MPPTLALDIRGVILEKRSTRRSQEGSTSMIKTIRRPLGVVVGFLALGGVVVAATHYLYEPYNPGFLEYPTIVALHVILGGLYLALAPFQFVRRIRSRHLGYIAGLEGSWSRSGWWSGRRGCSWGW
jgi:hypothetical protein